MNAVSNSVVMYKNGGYDPSTRLLAAICGGGAVAATAVAGGSLTKHNGVKVFRVLGHANDKFCTYSYLCKELSL